MCGIVIAIAPESSGVRLPIPPSGQKKTTIGVVLFYNFCIYFVKYFWECNSDIGKHFSVEFDIFLCHAVYKSAVGSSFFSNNCWQSLDSKLSKISLLFFSRNIRMLSLFYQCKSYLFIYLASSESKPLCKIDKFFVSSLSLKPVRYSYHLNYWL